jgi:hypothetical protein
MHKRLLGSSSASWPLNEADALELPVLEYRPLTGNHLGPLEVFIGMNVAGGDGEVEADG